ncbi:MAG: SsrA-binding protein [Candidatus Magasanikbacteria bacterium CG11_big_fil_rev_8_21_14_0_20_39_34]|uniref:SsrA-binding protein n=1 Tax=Candidatus Magasanikbacteria bacterium CG11_big_fil_rev_8_21_14_0_20_39_34 TaxID=1974653 RepID=A0A2H0N4J8_9BACT|nr:MAG: SsrA-binding protein [Candidatus Magasanikbacteria bacterium CG11_big_fil_rev_8_21_14_0_20_39_34]
MPTYAVNKKARFDYEIQEKLEAGLMLLGSEAKAVRTGNVKLSGSYVTFHKNEPMITGLHIPKYKYSGHLKEYDPERSRKLLLSQKQIAYIQGKSQEKGLTIIPLSIYTKGRYIKVEIGVCRGKKTHDKRRVIKKRELDRETRRAIKGDYR